VGLPLSQSHVTGGKTLTGDKQPARVEASVLVQTCKQMRLHLSVYDYVNLLMFHHCSAFGCANRGTKETRQAGITFHRYDLNVLLALFIGTINTHSVCYHADAT
jgi:hypothetical protein